jgi:hypothetical protein
MSLEENRVQRLAPLVDSKEIRVATIADIAWSRIYALDIEF